MLLPELLNALAKKAGIDINSPEFLKIVQDKAIAVDVPDAISNSMETSLFDINAAKNHPDLASHFKSLNFNGVDAQLKRTLQELGIDESIISELGAEQSTIKRMSNAIKKVKDLEAAKAAASGPSDKKEIQKQIDDLTSKLKEGETAWKSEKESLISQYEGKLSDLELENMLSEFNFAFPKEMPKSVQLQSARLLISNAIQEKGAQLVRENGRSKLVTKDGLDFMDEKHNKLDLRGFAQKTFADNKLLATVTDPAKRDNNVQNRTTGEGFKVNDNARESAANELAAVKEMFGRD